MSTRISSPSRSYASILASSEKVRWTVDDLIGGDKQLDFKRPFLPESLARVRDVVFLSPPERLLLNQVRGHEYLCTFGLVEEFILPFVLDQARPRLRDDDHRTRALLGFASEEAKHIHLFKRFREEFERGFGARCDVIGPPEAVATEVLSRHPLSVALTILHIEWMTQRHYTESVVDDETLDPRFKSLLKHHWMEEAQHAELDTLLVEALAEGCDRDEIESAIDGYLGIGAFLDEGLRQQVQLDLEALQRVSGRQLTPGEREEFLQVQGQAVRWTYLGTGMTHPRFLATVERLSPPARRLIEEEVAPTFC